MEFLPTEPDGKKVYAGFWKRFGATIVDFLILIPFIIIFHSVQGTTILVAMIAVVVWSIASFVYTVYFHYRFGATIGKMAVRIKVTLPNGYPIGFRQAFLRSSVDLGFAIFLVTARVVAISRVDPEQYLTVSWWEREAYIRPVLPAWYGIVDLGSQLWFWSELIVLLFNKRKRAIHDFIAGTVVIHRKYVVDDAQQDTANAAPVS